MALIVEDGTGKSDANALVSLAEVTAYHLLRGNAAWAAIATDALKEAAIVKATDYIGQVYRLRWSGYRFSDTQALDWPRFEVPRKDSVSIWSYWPYDEVPTEVKNACAELALKASTDELSPDLGQGVVREKVDVIEVEYDKYSPQSPRYTAIDRLLAPFLSGSSASRTVVRS
jgi:hypothetical protein